MKKIANSTNQESTLNDRIMLHERMIATIPNIDHITSCKYDSKLGRLTDFIDSSFDGVQLSDDSKNLSDYPLLNKLATSGDSLVIEDIETAISQIPFRKEWMLSEGFHSSFTIPIYDRDSLIGIIFLHSFQSNAFVGKIQRDIRLHAKLIKLSFVSEHSSTNSLTASVNIAKEFTVFRDFETGAHIERMARYALVIARRIAPIYKLTDQFVEQIFLFSPLHDIGKIAIPDSILRKPARYNAEERKIMQSHVSKGVSIVEKIISQYHLEDLEDSKMMKNIVSCHHEYLDGSGYPRGLEGADIPIEARIVTVADIFDALTSKRPYKHTWSITDAFAELQRMADAGKIDKDCVNSLVNSSDEIVTIHNNFQ